jgi:hypothetical protein
LLNLYPGLPCIMKTMNSAIDAVWLNEGSGKPGVIA